MTPKSTASGQDLASAAADRASEPEAPSHKQAAILAADVVGYAQMMEADEAATHRLIKALFAELVEPEVNRCQGRVIRLIGDGALAEFADAVAALEAAVAVQQALQRRVPAKPPPAGRIALRIGINFGEVIVDEGSLYGTGVNIAARLEALAEPDGIFLSEAAHEAVRGASRHQFADLGSQHLKNIEAPIRVYRVLFDGAAPAAAPAELGAPALPACPYRGLLPFGEADALYYFGRAASAEELEQAVRARPLVALLGASGSGKSSLVFAGLVPRLRAAGDYLIEAMRPERAPLQNLHAALGRLSAASAPPDRQRLLIVDQFEQIYTLCEAEARQRFLLALLQHVEAQACKVLVTLRADFLAQALAHRPLADALRRADVKLGPMEEAELRAAIELPAYRQGVRFEVGLVDRILADIRHQPGRLPLLQFTLTELWSRQQYGRLTYAAYDAIGGVKEAIASYAEAIFRGFSQSEQDRVRRIFLRLVQPGAGTDDTARIASQAELGTADWSAVDQLADTRLLVTRNDERSGAAVAEVVHEALLQEWQRLRQWIEADRQFLLWRHRLGEARRAWQDAAQADGYLLREAPLLVARAWLASRASDLAEEDRQFIAQSQARHDARERAARRRRNQVTATLAGLSLLFFCLFLGVVRFWQESQTQQRAAQAIQSRYYADLSLNELRHGEPLQAVATALAALPADLARPDRPYVGEAEVQLYRALEVVQGTNVLPHDGAAIWHAEVSPDGRYLASGANDGAIRLFQMGPAAPTLLRRLAGHQDAVLDLCFCADSKFLASAAADGTVALQALPDGAVRHLQGHQDAVVSIACNSAGPQVVSASWDGTAIVWDLTTDRALSQLPGTADAALTSATFDPTGQLILTTAQDGSATLWHWAERRVLHRLAGQGGPIWWGAFDPAGRRVLTASEGQEVDGANPGVNPTERINTLWLWDVASGRRLLSLDGHAEGVLHAAFSPNTRQDPAGGGLVATASRDGTARVWDSLTGRLLVVLDGHGGPVLRVAFDASGQRVATAARDGLARLFDPRSGALIGFPARHGGAAVQVTFSADGRRLISAGEDGTLVVANAEPGRQLARFDGHHGPVGLVALAPNAPNLVLTASRSHTIWGAQMQGDSTARLWDALTGREVAALKGHSQGIRAAAFAADGSALVTGAEDGLALWWSGAGGWHLARRLAGHAGPVRSVALHPDGQHVATASEDGTVRIWSATDIGSTSLRLPEPVPAGAEARVVGFNHRGDRLVTGFSNGAAWLWRWTADGHAEPLAPLDRGGGAVLTASFAPDDRLLVTTTEGPAGIVSLWQGQDGAGRGRLVGHQGSVAEAVFSSDGRWLATSAEDDTARLWDLATQQTVAVMRGHQAGVPSLALATLQGRPRVLTGSWDGTVRLWDGLTGMQLALFSGHELGVPDVALAPDGRFAVSASWDGTARVWAILQGGQPLIDTALALAAGLPAAPSALP